MPHNAKQREKISRFSNEGNRKTVSFFIFCFALNKYSPALYRIQLWFYLSNLRHFSYSLYSYNNTTSVLFAHSEQISHLLKSCLFQCVLGSICPLLIISKLFVAKKTFLVYNVFAHNNLITNTYRQLATL